MPMRMTVALTAAALTGLLVLTAAILAMLEPTRGSIGVAAIGGPAALLWAALGVVIVRRGAGARVGLLMTLVAFNIALTVAKEAGWVVLAARPDAQTDFAWLVAVLNESAWWLFALLSLVLLYFPDGRTPSPRWRFLAPVLLASAAIHQASSAMAPAFRPPLEHLEHPFPPPPLLLDIAGLVGFLVLVLGFVACAASVVVRYRGADALRRAQIRWLGLFGFGVPGFLLVCLVEVYVFGGPSWPSVAVGIAALIGLPGSIAIAMLRHSLYDIDRALATTATYATTTAILVAVFIVASATTGLVLGRGSAAAAAAAATALCAVALSPLRNALQRKVDRRLYPLRRAALAAIQSLEQRTHTGEAQPEELEQELRAALREPGLRVAYRLPGANGFVDTSGTAVGTTGSVPVVMGGSEIGALLPTSNTLSPSLLREVAQASGTLVEIVRLRVELTAAVHELENSRARLVEVSDEERRRLERDLHDGAQQRLVSLGMSLRLAQRHLGDGRVDVDAMIDQSVAEIGTAVAELRQIAHGLRPSRLDDGLPAALLALSRSLPVPVELSVTPSELPASVATTVYFVASEALANAVKHAEATRIDVRVAQCEQGVEVSVEDNGKGGAVLRHGSGLSGLRDRVAALGGSFSVDTSAGRGTLVHAVLPCAL